VNPDTKYQNEKTLKIGENTIHEAEQIDDPDGQKTISEIIIQSINVGSAKLGLRIGKDNLYRNFKKFGFSLRTGISLPGEETGIFNEPQKWKDIEQATIPFGQGIGITPIQLISYVSAIGNDGYWQTPKIIQKVGGEDPKIKYTRKKILESKTAWQLRTMMQEVVRKGSGTAAAVPGYSIGGKTGTAQKINPATGRYDNQNYISSFVGLAPLKRPKIAVLVVIDSPHREYYGGVVAAPVFREIAQTALRVLNVGPDENPPLP
jgi:cell division protein FtsI/penicillin-binding protein 2